jgi:hypothetical protein
MAEASLEIGDLMRAWITVDLLAEATDNAPSSVRVVVPIDGSGPICVNTASRNVEQLEQYAVVNLLIFWRVIEQQLMDQLPVSREQLQQIRSDAERKHGIRQPC